MVETLMLIATPMTVEPHVLDEGLKLLEESLKAVA